MTYNEWRDELKSNLLCVSESERKRVLDYYAEAYADRREAGFSEREIIQDFGAPYDAAQRILQDNKSDYYQDEPAKKQEPSRRQSDSYSPPPPQYAQPAPPPPPQKANDYTWVFVLLCVIFCIPLMSIIFSMIIVTVSFCIAPFAVVISGAAIAVSSVIVMVNGEIFAGIASFGAGLIVLGVGILLFPLFIKLVKLMWWLFNKVFNWLKSLFKGNRGYAQ